MQAHKAADRAFAAEAGTVQGSVKILLTSLSPALELGSSAGRIWGVQEHRDLGLTQPGSRKGDHHLLNMERDYPISETTLPAHEICINCL